MFVLRGVRSTFVVSASSQTIPAARSASTRSASAAGSKASAPERYASPKFSPTLPRKMSWISGSGSALPNPSARVTIAGVGTGRSSACASPATSASATSAFAPWPAPWNLTTNAPPGDTSSARTVSTTAGSEPPSRRGTT